MKIGIPVKEGFMRMSLSPQLDEYTEKTIPTIQILLSTYNALRFIQEQLDSLQGQTGVNVRILIRDDGSTDDTPQILERYCVEHENTFWYSGENLKPTQSFLRLIEDAPDAEYYALCDQDDVWDADKLLSALNHIKGFDADTPVLYYSNLRIVDQELNFIRLSHSSPAVQKNKYASLLEPMPSGCTMVFNRALKNLLCGRMPQFCSSHDTWIYLVAKFFGETIYEFEPHISYRQHGDNVIGAFQTKGLELYYQKFKNLFNRNGQPRLRNSLSFIDCYGDLLDEKDRDKVEELANYKNSLANRIKLLCDREICVGTRMGDLRAKIMIILGTI